MGLEVGFSVVALDVVGFRVVGLEVGGTVGMV